MHRNAIKVLNLEDQVLTIFLDAVHTGAVRGIAGNALQLSRNR